MKMLDVLVGGMLAGITAMGAYAQQAGHELTTYEPAPQLLTSVECTYPRSALEENVEGRVVVCALIDTNGIVTDVSIEESSGRADLDSSAMDCACQYVFSPAMHQGNPVESTVFIPVEYKLH
ncbi:MAG: energy transducer TonB [archaeon]